MLTKSRATIDDLYRVDGKAELVGGEIVHMAPTGDDPAHAGGEVFAALREYAKETRRGRAVPDNAGFRVDLPGRESFSPDAAYYVGPPAGMRFYDRAPMFAVEVRSLGDYGPAAEQEMARKRADYFAAGTQVVWDVDLQAPEFVVNVYRATDPERPTRYRRGEIAEAEPAVPGWRMPVDDLFAPEDADAD